MRFFPFYLTHSNSPRARASRTVITAIAAFLILAGAALAASPGPGPQVGTNLGYLNDLAGEWPFVDVFKTSSPWYLSGPNCGWNCSGLNTDDDGWVTFLGPGQHASTFVFTQVPGAMPHASINDHYHVYYDGVGQIEYDGSASLVSHQPGHDVVAVDPNSDLAFAITILSTGLPGTIAPATDYISNIRVIAPGGVCSNDPFLSCQTAASCPSNPVSSSPTCDLFADNTNYETQIFHPDFLANARMFDVVRVMDWMETIEGDIINYDDHPTVQSARWSPAPASIMAELANRLDADLWINIPHVADTSFAAAFAADLVPVLETDRKLYVEYANEVWNWSFPVYSYTTTMGCAAYPTLDCDDPDQKDLARARYTVDRSLAIWGDFAAAFDALPAPSSSANQLVRVLASLIGDTDLHQALLSHRNVYQSTDAFAIAGYFGWSIGGDDVVQTWGYQTPADLDPIFARLTQEVDDTLWDMESDRQFLAGNSLYSSIDLVLYEGGQGLVARDNNEDPIDPDGPTGPQLSPLEHANRVFNAANRDPRMGDMYARLLDTWRDRGGVLFNHYVNCRSYRPWQRYGALEHQRQPHNQSAKYWALRTFINNLP